MKEERSVVNSLATKSLKAADFEPTGVTAAMDSPTDLPEPPANESSTSISSAVKSTTESANNAPPAAPTPQTNTKTQVKKPSAAAPVIGPSEPAATVPRPSKDRFSLMSYNDFALSQESVLEHYSEIQDLMTDTKEYLFRNCDVLLHEHAQTYMLLSCLEDEMNKKHKRMKLVCRQSQLLSHIQELANSMRKDTRDVILPFFKRLEEAEHMKGFLSSVEDFIEKIKKRAVEKRKEMDLEREEEEKKRKELIAERVKAGGLDPYEVLAQLPAPLREAFESQDIARLNEVLAEMDPSDAKKYMKMCVDSGLWVPKDESVFEEGEEEDGEEEGSA